MKYLKSLKKHRGSSLIEVMISAVIFSSGLVSAVGLQGVAKVSAYEAQQRTVASFIANDIIERLRLNRSWIQQNTSANPYLVTGLGLQQQTLPECASKTGLMTNCSGAEQNQMALYQSEGLLLGQKIAVNKLPFPALSEPLACLYVNQQGVASVFITWKGRNSEVTTADSAKNQLQNIANSELSAMIKTIVGSSNYAKNCGLDSNNRHVHTLVTALI